MNSLDPSQQLAAKIAQLPVSEDAVMCQLLRTTLLAHARQGHDITEPAVLGLLAIAGVLEERLTRLEATIPSATAPCPSPP